MCNCPILIRFKNPLGRTKLYGLGGYNATFEPQKKGRIFHRSDHTHLAGEYKHPHFASLPSSSYHRDPSAWATYFGAPIIIRKPDYKALQQAINDNPLSIPTRTCGLYVPFKIEDAEPDTYCMFIPCGKCYDCINKRVNEWCFRLEKDLTTTKNCQSYFVTFTYDSAHLPVDGVVSPRLSSLCDSLEYQLKRQKGKFRFRYLRRLAVIRNIARKADSNGFIHDEKGILNYRDFQLFMKRFRELLRRWYSVELKYFVCGEYGKNTARPHFHAIIWFERTVECNGYEFTGYLRGKPSIMSKYIERHKRVPMLNDSMFERIIFATYGLCQWQAFVCEPLRNSSAAARYICKYMTKNQLFMPRNLEESSNVLSVPPCYHRSQHLAYNWADKFQEAILDPEHPLESIVRKYNKNGQTLEYLQNVPTILYDRAFQNVVSLRYADGLDYDVESRISRDGWLSFRLQRYNSIKDTIDPFQHTKDIERSLRLSNLQMYKNYE